MLLFLGKYLLQNCVGEYNKNIYIYINQVLSGRIEQLSQNYPEHSNIAMLLRGKPEHQTTKHTCTTNNLLDPNNTKLWNGWRNVSAEPRAPAYEKSYQTHTTNLESKLLHHKQAKAMDAANFQCLTSISKAYVLVKTASDSHSKLHTTSCKVTVIIM